MHEAPRLRIGELLVQAGQVTENQVRDALAIQRATGKLLGEILLEQGIITRAVLEQTLSARIGVPGCVLRHGLIDPALLELIGEQEALELRALPLFRVHGTLTVAMAEPQSLHTIDRLRSLTELEIRPVLALEPDIREYIKKYAGGKVDVDGFMTQLVDSDVSIIERESIEDETIPELENMIDGSPIVNLVNVALLTAIRDGASDIHIEPDKRGTRIRYRIDGTLRELMRPPIGLHPAIISRVKVIGKMDIAEKRLPQAGRVRIVAEGREIDLRVSSIPTLLGEKVVVRILDKENLRVRLEDLGFRAEALERFKHMLHQPHGMILVTGPTGSGKTTTLYSALELIQTPERNIVTVEDPVEYQLDMVNQVQVHDSIGMTFASALRSILRQDPDVVMIGEVRDEETARVAVRASLTGHLVLATLHTNDAPGSVARLLDMGIEPYLVSTALNGAVAQRLARTVCGQCRTKYFPEDHVLEEARISNDLRQPFQKGLGCQHCHDTGFKGRSGIYEVMEVTPTLRRMIHKSAPTHTLRLQMSDEGCLTLREEGIALARAGKTSLEEVLRVTHSHDSDIDDADTDMPTETLGRAA
ncbi:MAG: Flp pilus assembly complex ATPase component TadA [Phycisphaeraceae bacterium]|nr:Flp pilus assembly complex ATPase component TadA [Phycisphaerales bacterium]MCB9860474.1 Flp pilus assembly complex ATPase component TadA [Phycisphaeraceae bacterium]